MTKNEQDILRRLGAAYMEYASLPVQKEKRDLWKALNQGKMQRPMVNIDQLPWNELEGGEDLACQVTDPYWRGVEQSLRRTLYQWRHFPADMVLEPFLTIPAVIQSDRYGLKPQSDSIHTREGETAVARHYNAVIETMEDISKIHDIFFTCDREESARHLQEGQAIFDGIVPVILGHGVTFHLGIWDALAEYLSVENLFYDFIDRPEFLHAVLERITQATIAGIHRANELQIVDDIAKTCHCSYLYNDRQLPDFGVGQGSVSGHSWAFGLAQILTSTSPAVFEEFELPYISRMAQEFDSIYYGCCDRLDNKLDLVKKIPNVRKVSCSPWSDRRAFAENLGHDLILSNKPTPAYLATASMDEDVIRKDFEFTCQCAKENGVGVELILKDVSTVQFDPRRLTRWEEIAMKVMKNW